MRLSLPPQRVKLLATGLAGLAVMGFLGWLAFARIGAAERVLFGGLAPADLAPVTAVLDGAGIAYRLAPDGGAVLVGEAELGRARMLVAGRGLPNAGPAGYELMDRAPTLGSTQFRDEITYARALEGELARTIGSLAGVRSAKVHLVMARREPFSRSWTPPSASVMLGLGAPDLVGREQVSAIRHLVASAVPRLAAANVAVVDTQGNLLARADAGAGAELDHADQRRVALEDRIARAIEEQLSPIVGPGRVRAKVSAVLGQASERRVEESFDPAAQVARSQQAETERDRTDETEPNVSVERDLPESVDRPPPAPTSRSDRERQRQTTNYEIGKTVREQVTTAGEIKRLSVSIAVDGIRETADGRTACSPRPPEDSAGLERLARATAGISAERGDLLEIASVPFVGLEPLPESLPAPPAGLAAPLALGGLGLGLALALGGGAAYLLWRRGLRRAQPAAAPEAAAPMAAAAAEPPAALQATAAAAPSQLPAPGVPGPSLPPPEPEEPMVELGRNIQGSVRQTTIHRVQQMIDANLEDAAMFLRDWLHEKREAR